MLERFPDDGDAAAAQELHRNEQAARLRDRPPEPFDGKPEDLTEEDLTCVKCDDEMLPVRRRMYGYTTCITCAEREDRERAMRGG